MCCFQIQAGFLWSPELIHLLGISSSKVNDRLCESRSVCTHWCDHVLEPGKPKPPLFSEPCVSCCFPLGPQRCADSRKHQLQALRLNLGLNAFESKFLGKYQVLSGIKLQQISKELSSALSVTWARTEDGTFWYVDKKAWGTIHLSKHWHLEM